MDPILVALDTAALSATLGGALVLSTVGAARDGAPWPVEAMTVAGIQVAKLDLTNTDSLFYVERQWVRDALVTAGAAVLTQCLPPLAVVHVLTEFNSSAALKGRPTELPLPDPWATAHVWWYPV